MATMVCMQHVLHSTTLTFLDQYEIDLTQDVCHLLAIVVEKVHVRKLVSVERIFDSNRLN